MTIQVMKVPDIGEGVTQVEVVAWHVAVGDLVQEDQGLVDIMTEKAAVELPSPVAGRITALLAKVGDTVAVGSDLVRIELPSEAWSEPPAETTSELSSGPRPEHVPLEPVPPEPALIGKPLASPSVRRHARSAGVPLVDVRGSGPDGRILHADIEAFQGAGSVAAPTAPSLQSQGLSPVRKAIARKMEQAARVPHYSYVEEVDVTELEALRHELNAQWAGEKGHLTVLPFILRAMVCAVRQHPFVNAWYEDHTQQLTLHAAIHVGLAVQTEQGLMVPVLRDAQSMGLWGSAAEMRRLAAVAREGRAAPAQLKGSTLSLTSLGALGGVVSTPMLNVPEVAIVGVNRIVERPACVGGQVSLRKQMNLSSTFDHRVIDGAQAAAFVQAVRRHLEHPALLFIDLERETASMGGT